MNKKIIMICTLTLTAMMIGCWPIAKEKRRSGGSKTQWTTLEALQEKYATNTVKKTTVQAVIGNGRLAFDRQQLNNRVVISGAIDQRKVSHIALIYPQGSGQIFAVRDNRFMCFSQKGHTPAMIFIKENKKIAHLSLGQGIEFLPLRNLKSNDIKLGTIILNESQKAFPAVNPLSSIIDLSKPEIKNLARHSILFYPNIASGDFNNDQKYDSLANCSYILNVLSVFQSGTFSGTEEIQFSQHKPSLRSMQFSFIGHDSRIQRFRKQKNTRLVIHSPKHEERFSIIEQKLENGDLHLTFTALDIKNNSLPKSLASSQIIVQKNKKARSLYFNLSQNLSDLVEDGISFNPKIDKQKISWNLQAYGQNLRLASITNQLKITYHYHQKNKEIIVSGKQLEEGHILAKDFSSNGCHTISFEYKDIFTNTFIYQYYRQ